MVLGVYLSILSLPAVPTPSSRQAVELRLDDYINLVLENNESIQAQMLEAEVNRRKSRAEYGAFEPEWVTSVEREVNNRQNNTEQAAALGGVSVLQERNNIYDSGIESLIPTGAKIRLGATLSDLNNNIPPISGLSSSNSVFFRQYQTFVGVTLTQPLLKNAGSGVTMANIRLAAMDSDIAFQEYRRQLMLTISQAEVAYWNLYFAQEQVRFFDDSVAVAETILADSQEKLNAGQGSELDVLEARSGLALRHTKQNDAVQNSYEALARLQALYGAAPLREGMTIRAVDAPQMTNAAPSYYERFQVAFDLNPDYLIQLKKVDQAKVRLGLANNQRLPEFNFKGSYGFNGLGNSPSQSFDDLTGRDFPSWSAGLELHLPLLGGIKERNIFSAAKLSLQAALVNLNGVQTQISHALNLAILKAQNRMESVHNYETVVHFNEDLLKTQLARLNVGKVEGRKVLEVEADLLDTRQNLADVLVQYERALLEAQLAEGSILQSRKLELTRDELQKKTMTLLKSHKLPMEVFRPLPNIPANRPEN
jgi:outer membrane protein TolC